MQLLGLGPGLVKPKCMCTFWYAVLKDNNPEGYDVWDSHLGRVAHRRLRFVYLKGDLRMLHPSLHALEPGGISACIKCQVVGVHKEAFSKVTYGGYATHTPVGDDRRNRLPEVERTSSAPLKKDHAYFKRVGAQAEECAAGDRANFAKYNGLKGKTPWVGMDIAPCFSTEAALIDLMHYVSGVGRSLKKLAFKPAVVEDAREALWDLVHMITFPTDVALRGPNLLDASQKSMTAHDHLLAFHSGLWKLVVAFLVTRQRMSEVKGAALILLLDVVAEIITFVPPYEEAARCQATDALHTRVVDAMCAMEEEFPQCLTLNFHYLSHMAEQIYNHGALRDYWLYGEERLNQHMIGRVRNRARVLACVENAETTAAAVHCAAAFLRAKQQPPAPPLPVSVACTDAQRSELTDFLGEGRASPAAVALREALQTGEEVRVTFRATGTVRGHPYRSTIRESARPMASCNSLALLAGEQGGPADIMGFETYYAGGGWSLQLPRVRLWEGCAVDQHTSLWRAGDAAVQGEARGSLARASSIAPLFAASGAWARGRDTGSTVYFLPAHRGHELEDLPVSGEGGGAV